MLQLIYKNSDKRPLWLVDALYTVGSDPSCDIHVSDAAVAAHQADVLVSQQSVSIRNLGVPSSVSVNGEAVAQSRPIEHGDSVAIGSQHFTLADPKLGRASVGKAAEASASVAPSLSGWRLQANTTALSNKDFPIDAETIVGRSNECDIVLGVAHLSRKHAKLFFSGKDLIVEDLGSSNGTFVNGKKVERATLNNGDDLRFDTLSFKVSGPPPTGVHVPPEADMDDDGDKTTVRPSIQVGAVQASRPKPARPSKSTAKANPVSQATQSYSAYDDSEEGGSSGLIVGFIVVVVLLAAAWYFLF